MTNFEDRLNKKNEPNTNNSEILWIKTNKLFEAFKKEWGYLDPNEPIYVYGKVEESHRDSGNNLFWLTQTISTKTHERLDLNQHELDSYGNFKIKSYYKEINIKITNHKNKLHQGDKIKAKIKLSYNANVIEKQGIALEAFFTEKLSDEEWKELIGLKKSIDLLKTELNRVFNLKEKTELSLSKLKDELYVSKNEFDSIKNEIQDARKNRDSIKEEITILNNKRGFLGFKEIFDVHETDASDASLSLETLAKRAHAALISSGDIYDLGLIQDFTALLSTHDVIVLAGSSGTGKTLLCREFARVTSSKVTIIPVKPNWTSADDLIGYYSPIENRFIGTPFVEAIREAQKDPQKLHLICLDEMNLARPEYYFADFLSLLENRKIQRRLQLYIPSEFSLRSISEINKGFFKILPQGTNKNNSPLEIIQDPEIKHKAFNLLKVNNSESYLNAFKQLHKFNSEENNEAFLSIPDNVRFIGTMNVDETTNFLAPKILDRVHILRLENPIFSINEAYPSNIEKNHEKPFVANSSCFGKLDEYPEFNLNSSIVQKLLRMGQEVFKSLNIDISLRLLRQTQHYAIKAKLCGQSEMVILSNVLKHKLLPKCIFDNSFCNTSIDPAEKLQLLIDNYELSKDCQNDIRRLINMQNEHGTINWWL